MNFLQLTGQVIEIFHRVLGLLGFLAFQNSKPGAKWSSRFKTCAQGV